MSIHRQQKNAHWPYYLSLESDVVGLSRYIEFDRENYGTYSTELARVLLATGSEVDALLKKLCKLFSPNRSPNRIDRYKSIVIQHLPSIHKQKVVSRRFELALRPWSNWSGDAQPDWWRAYNLVKHQRNLNFKEANLKNVLHSVAGLYLLNIHYHHHTQQSRTDYPLDFRNTLHNLLLGEDLFRVDDPFVYLRD